jgi:60 kDa SS-A/Ro ribonucleoprotein
MIKDEYNRSCKFYPIAYTLAVCARSTSQSVSEAAYAAIQTVCKTPEQLFMFLHYCQESIGGMNLKTWPRKHRKAIARWYTENPQYRHDPIYLARHVTKYRKRHGFTHKKVLKSCHPKSSHCSAELKYILCYVVKGIAKANQTFPELMNSGRTSNQNVAEFLTDVETIKKKRVPEDDTIALIKKWNLTWENIPTEFLRFKEVWRALLLFMPMTALLRNLGKLTKYGLLQPGSEEEARVCSRIENKQILQGARLHPIQILSSLNGYRRGRGLRTNQRRWAVNPNIVQSLMKAFVAQLNSTIQPPNQSRQILVAINTQISMDNHVVGIPLMNCKQTAAAIAMTLKVCHSSSQTVTFGSANTAQLFPLQRENNMFDVEQNLEEIQTRQDRDSANFKAPFQYALENMTRVDAVILMTDHLTPGDQIDIRDAYAIFREHSPNTLLITVCFKKSEEVPPVADPRDPQMLDVIGVDSHAVDTILSFISGQEQEQYRGILRALTELRMEEDMDED